VVDGVGKKIRRSSVESGFEKTLMEAAQPALARLALGLSEETSARGAGQQARKVACFHCGEPCLEERFHQAGKAFCCQGCQVVHDLLAENGLQQFYSLTPHPGVRVGQAAQSEKWACLDEPELQAKLLDFTDGKSCHITLHIPAIHCVACVWLLENLFRLNPGVGRTVVNFSRREASIRFAPGRLKLSELVSLLTSIGYEPRLTLGELGRTAASPSRQRQWLQVGIAGFAFGNIMLFSLPAYLGLDSFSGPLFRGLFGYLSLALALPVLLISAADYWRSAFLSIRQRVLTLDVPIALGLVALYAQSAYEIISGRGEGYLDSMSGLIFFLLCGRAFQQKAQDRIVFDRDYRSFFPLSVMRRSAGREESVAISNLRVGDRLVLRNGELIPADARLVSGPALIDYSFVTGEADPVARQAGDYLYAGGKQMGSAIEVETLKPVSQSYLTSLWGHEAFRKNRADPLNTLTNRYSRRFTRLVVVVAVGAALFWILRGEAARGVKAFASVLIVACPCALALAAPFVLGTAQRLLARLQVFLKNSLVLERLACVDTVVFDKTGTLTSAQSRVVNPGLNSNECDWVCCLARQSFHPHSVRIVESLTPAGPARTEPAILDPQGIQDYAEVPGRGISARVNGHELRLGSRAWLIDVGVTVPELNSVSGSTSYLAIDGKFRGVFTFTSALRSEIERLLQDLGRTHELILLSGDNERDQVRFRGLFGENARLHFNQTPMDKLRFVSELQRSGKRVMMVGDGLNDAGALQQSNLGVAVVERAGSFSPASDLILEAARVPQLSNLVTFAQRSVQVVHWSFGISALYNLVGISIAAAGILSPIVCAILMPLSSLSVVLFACGATNLAARRSGLSARSTLPAAIATS
jgi:P-type Cu+ transporter